MKQIKLGIGILVVSSMLTSCGTMTGALLGAGIGAIAGDPVTGALIGAGLGLAADTCGH
jgi:predicted small secreted protein